MLEGVFNKMFGLTDEKIIKQKKVVNKIKVKLDKFYKKFLCKIREIVFTIYNYIDTLNYNFKNDLRNLE